jgi:hypothetical protein
MNFRLLEKHKQVKHKLSRWKETTKFQAEINAMETKAIQGINEAKVWFF